MFLLDANVLIDASRRYYAHDIAPQFWEWLENEHAKGAVGSIRKVRDELVDKDSSPHDFLTRWALGLPESFWQTADESMQPSLQEVSTWTFRRDPPYTPAAINEFLGVADFFLVAQALAGDHTVVTFELPAPHAKRRVLIPDACCGVNVRCAQPFDVYRSLGLRLG